QRPCGAAELPAVPAHPHGPGAEGDHRQVPHDRLRSDGSWRTGAAARGSRDHERDLRGDWREDPLGPVGEARISLGVIARRLRPPEAARFRRPFVLVSSPHKLALVLAAMLAMSSDAGACARAERTLI